MPLEGILRDFLKLTQDAVGVGYRGPGDETARWVYVNPSFEKLFGGSSEDICGRRVDEIHDTSSWDAFLDEVRPRFESGETEFSAETRCIRADGSSFWASISFFVVNCPDTKGRYSCATYRDITDLKEREATATRALSERDAALAEKEGMYRDLAAAQDRLISAMDAYPDPFVIYDKDMRLVTCNAAYKISMAGRPDSIRPGMHIKDVLNEAIDSGKMAVLGESKDAYIDRLLDPARLDIPVEDLEFTGDVHHRVHRSIAANGDVVIIRLDTTELVRQRKAADRARERLLAALSAYPDPIVIYDPDLLLVCWNDAYADALTDDPSELREGMPLGDVLSIGIRNGRFPEAEGREDAWLAELLAPEMIASDWNDMVLAGDIHHRNLRARSSSGDYIVVRLNTTELVRERRAAEEAQTRLIAALNAYPSPFTIYDSDDRLVVWNDAYRKSMTDDPSEMREGMHLRDVVRLGLKNGRFAEAVGCEDEWLARMVDAAANTVPVEDMELAGDTHHRVLRSRSENGDLVMVRIDTTELVQQRRKLQATQDRLMSAINAFPDPFAIYDENLNLVVWNPAYAASMTDHPSDLSEGIGLKDALRIAARDGRIPGAIGREEEWVENYYHPDVLKTEVEDFEFADDRHYRMVRSRGENGEYLVLRINLTEVVRQRRELERYAQQLELANKEITHKAFHDQLTGVGNRRYLAQKFEDLVKTRREKGGELAALHVDLDRFKQINDTIGHSAGDYVLIKTTERIRLHTGANDVVARTGGDEFVVLLHVPENSDRPEQLAHALLEELSKPLEFEGRPCRYGASIGLARTPIADEGDLLPNSDIALYKAKRAGRGQLGVYDRTDTEEMRRVSTLGDDIMRGIEASEFIPYYQPQIDCRSGQVVGMEALARWRHPRKGILGPYEFLTVATDLNVIAEIDRMIFEKAIEECQNALGQFTNPPSLSFNVSAKRIHEEDVDRIGQKAREYSGQVSFELLETIFLEEQCDKFLFQLDALRESGITLEVDDFGSGRASVIALQHIGPDRLKIDRRLIAPIGAENSAARLVQSIIEIGRALEIEITAEGVETSEQAELLARMGCDRMQGYFFAKPMNLQELHDYLNGRPAPSVSCTNGRGRG